MAKRRKSRLLANGAFFKKTIIWSVNAWSRDGILIADFLESFEIRTGGHDKK